jgi:hypothetical protein
LCAPPPGSRHLFLPVPESRETIVRAEWRGRSDYLLSRVRRRVAEAREMGRGGWRALLAR